MKGDNFSPQGGKIILSDGTIVDMSDICHALLSGLNDGSKYLSIFDYVSKHNEQGKVFGLHIRDTIPGSDTVEFAFKIPARTTKRIEALPTIITCNKEIYIDFYANVGVTNGINVKDDYVICMNQYINNDSVIEELLAGATINTGAAGAYNTFRDYIPASRFSGGGQSIQFVDWITQPDCYYSSKLENLEVTEATYSMILYWIEHDV